MFFNLINVIKINYKFKKKYIRWNLNKNELKLVTILLNLNIIKYIKKKNNIYDIYLNYHNENPVFKNIINMYKPSKITFVSLKELTKISKQKNWLIILSTSKGILTNFEALNKKTGGLILMKLWN